MKFLSLAPFVPSGSQFEASKQLFQDLGFTMTWNEGGMAGFENNGCRFILQKFEDRAFAENFMLSVRIPSVAAFRDMLVEKKLAEKFNIRIGDIQQQPYGKEINIIDLAGVCWHFIE